MNQARRFFETPSPLSMLGTIVAVAYFVWWGCASTAAPTLRPPTALPDGQRTQVGIGGNMSVALLNAGVGSTLWAQHRLTDNLEIGGFAEYGAIVSPLGLSLSGNLGDSVLGAGLSGRWYFLTDRSFRLGVEGYVAAAQTFQVRAVPYYASPVSPLTLAQTYISLPAAIGVGERFSLYTNPAAGLIELVQWSRYVAGPQLVTGGIPLPTFRAPLGAELRLNDWSSLIAEVGVAGILLVGMGPYASIGASVSF